ncbi:cupin domain-containing protein [Stappia sp. BW2]|jgi:quercetin dioxygenase-like cupin family protein|uniref:cupin domain-containing protein n=1 Tax=Stappia sp. BW2 TaxID=2592622 RepID=UPI0011DEEC54|nr:cupin domain-containing protein [Stappia sp. BW2]TYC65152.1 cupin domain-containing protein [Stappia sp. BW2]
MSDILLGPDAIEWLGVTYRTILSTGASGGVMSIVDSVSPPGSGPPRHIHEDADETFVLLTGDCEFWLEGERSVRGPGQTMFVPKGREHTFRVVSDLPSRHLVILSPGGLETFFEEMAAGQYRIPEDMPAIEESARRYHLTLTGPPLNVQ